MKVPWEDAWAHASPMLVTSEHHGNTVGTPRKSHEKKEVPLKSHRTPMGTPRKSSHGNTTDWPQIRFLLFDQFLVVTHHVYKLLGDRRKSALFHNQVTKETDRWRYINAICLSLVFPLKMHLSRNTNTFPRPITRYLPALQNNTITLAHFDDPCK